MEKFTVKQDRIETRGQYCGATILHGVSHVSTCLAYKTLTDCVQDYLFKDGCRVNLENRDSISPKLEGGFAYCLI